MYGVMKTILCKYFEEDVAIKQAENNMKKITMKIQISK